MSKLNRTPHRRARLARCWLVAALLLATLSGCSATRLVYNNADWLLQRELVKHTCPTEAQQDWLKLQLVSLHRWHRRQELPRYVRALRRLTRALDRPLTRPAVEALFDELDGARRRLSQRLAAPAAVYLEGLAAPQIACLVRQQQLWTTRLRRELRGPAEGYVARQRDKLEDRLDDWMGDLSLAQRGAVDRLLRARRPAHGVVARAWSSWGRRLVAVLRKAGPRLARTRRLRQAMTDRAALYSQRERAAVLAWSRSNRQLTWAAARLMTATQRARLKLKLATLAKDLQALSNQR